MLSEIPNIGLHSFDIAHNLIGNRRNDPFNLLLAQLELIGRPFIKFL